eukprot:CAMPEP_0183481492 /NCGR_PEP_ID=MMETSP0370-20130417/175041_1 /TAXON_ID=268820 /ORGANISM="Peridinium aciculiferum, Strain PAER-2" /LENGTH=367 /DNA_ID=CAMNT_0025674623 /DNA_START=36 /DNA_END=1140 /DNA_ORIENTATION=-
MRGGLPTDWAPEASTKSTEEPDLARPSLLQALAGPHAAGGAEHEEGAQQESHAVEADVVPRQKRHRVRAQSFLRLLKRLRAQDGRPNFLAWQLRTNFGSLLDAAFPPEVTEAGARRPGEVRAQGPVDQSQEVPARGRQGLGSHEPADDGRTGTLCQAPVVAEDAARAATAHVLAALVREEAEVECDILTIGRVRGDGRSVCSTASCGVQPSEESTCLGLLRVYDVRRDKEQRQNHHPSRARPFHFIQEPNGPGINPLHLAVQTLGLGEHTLAVPLSLIPGHRYPILLRLHVRERVVGPLGVLHVSDDGAPLLDALVEARQPLLRSRALLPNERKVALDNWLMPELDLDRDTSVQEGMLAGGVHADGP